MANDNHAHHHHKPDMFPQLKQSGDVPWDAIQRFAGHLSEKPEFLTDLVARLDYLITEDPWEEMDLEYVYLCAVVALAAPQLAPFQRERVLAVLRKGMSDDLATGDLAEDATRSALAAFNEPTYQESRTVEQWVRQYHKGFETWMKKMGDELKSYEKQGLGAIDDELDEELDDEEYAELEKKWDDLVGQFLQSDRCASIPEPHIARAEDVAQDLLRLAQDYLGVDAQEMTLDDARELLLDIIPAKLTADDALMQAIPSAGAAFMHFMADTKRSPHAAKIAAWMEKNSTRIVDACQDENNWGMSKGIAMEAIRAGVDLGDEEALERFMVQYNNRLLAAQQPKDLPPLPDDSFPEPIAPIRNDSPKVGRNDPCPCGSGKKYKKCCGK